MTASAQPITPCGSSDTPAAYWASACDIVGSAPRTVSGNGLIQPPFPECTALTDLGGF